MDILNEAPVEEVVAPVEGEVTPEAIETEVEQPPVKEVPEVFELPEDFVAVEGFDHNEIGKVLNLSQDEFGKLTEAYQTLETKRIEANHNAAVNAFREVVSEQDQPLFEAKMKGALGADYEVLRDAMSASHTSAASVAKLMQKYIMKAEHSPVAEVNTAPVLSEGELRAMMADPQYKTDPEYRKKVSVGFSKLYS